VDTERLRHYLENGFARDAEKRYQTNTALPSSTHNGMQLRLCQVIYHSGKLSRQDAGLTKIYHAPLLRVSEDDAKELNLENGNRVRVQSVGGGEEVEVAIEIAASLPKGMLWFPEHFSTLKDLMPVQIDPSTHVPYFKSGPVTIRKAPQLDLTVVA